MGKLSVQRWGKAVAERRLSKEAQRRGAWGCIEAPKVPEEVGMSCSQGRNR